jgi:nucleotide-binding universal stress UspA family protein
MSIVVAFPPDQVAGQRLLELGATHAERAGSELVILHRAKLEHLDEAAQVDRDLQEIDRGRHELEELAEGLGTRGIRARVRIVTSSADNPSSELLDIIRDEDPEMVVVGLRARSRVGKFLMGSTAQDLLAGSPCPVLAVKF